jgi:hypothetical protein
MRGGQWMLLLGVPNLVFQLRWLRLAFGFDLDWYRRFIWIGLHKEIVIFGLIACN